MLLLFRCYNHYTVTVKIFCDAISTINVFMSLMFWQLSCPFSTKSRQTVFKRFRLFDQEIRENTWGGTLLHNEFQNNSEHLSFELGNFPKLQINRLKKKFASSSTCWKVLGNDENPKRLEFINWKISDAIIWSVRNIAPGNDVPGTTKFPLGCTSHSWFYLWNFRWIETWVLRSYVTYANFKCTNSEKHGGYRMYQSLRCYSPKNNLLGLFRNRNSQVLHRHVFLLLSNNVAPFIDSLDH